MSGAQGRGFVTGKALSGALRYGRNMSDQGPILHTARLILRPTRREDFAAWASFAGDEECARYLGGVQTPAMAWRGFAAIAGSWQLYGFSMFSVIERATGRWVGRLGPWQPEGWPVTEVGWGLSRDAWGKGYALEGVTAAVDWAFDQLGWQEVIHAIDPANERSQAVAKRIGSTLRGPGKLPAPFDHAPIELWGQTKEQWRARTRA
jgi:RimJ/RimL family protein N-acetyltransferase